MRRYNFVLREEPDLAGKMRYAIEIAALEHSGFTAEKGLVTAIKQYDDETSYRRDVLTDFTSAFSGELKPNAVVYLSAERAAYYGWPGSGSGIENAA